MNKNKFISNIFILILFYFPVHATYNCLIAHYEVYKSKREKVDWEKLYPFSKKKNKITINKNNYLIKINNIFKSKTDIFDKKFNSYLPYRYKTSEIQMVLSKLLGIKIFLEYDGLVVLNNGYLDLYSKNINHSYEMKNTLDFHRFVKNINTDFIFVIYPCKNSKYDNQLPKGLKDNINFACDEFLKVLNDNKIKNLDLRENAKKDFKSQYDLFFKTDHHWKPSAGLWAAKELCKYLNFKLDWKINTSLLNKENFKTIILPQIFLGSEGKKITLTYAEPDDFEIIQPLYDTNFKRICPTWEQDKTGSFGQVMFDKSRIGDNDYYTNLSYYFYLHADTPYLRLINNSQNVYEKKICLIKDSFNNVVIPFLSLGIKDLTILDSRHFTGSIRTLIEKEKFDLVIVAYYASLGSGNKKLFDFN